MGKNLLALALPVLLLASAAARGQDDELDREIKKMKRDLEKKLSELEARKKELVKDFERRVQRLRKEWEARRKKQARKDRPEERRRPPAGKSDVPYDRLARLLERVSDRLNRLEERLRRLEEHLRGRFEPRPHEPPRPWREDARKRDRRGPGEWEKWMEFDPEEMEEWWERFKDFWREHHRSRERRRMRDREEEDMSPPAFEIYRLKKVPGFWTDRAPRIFRLKGRLQKVERPPKIIELRRIHRGD